VPVRVNLSGLAVRKRKGGRGVLWCKSIRRWENKKKNLPRKDSNPSRREFKTSQGRFGKKY
jgi:hypothetical protein